MWKRKKTKVLIERKKWKGAMNAENNSIAGLIDVEALHKAGIEGWRKDSYKVEWILTASIRQRSAKKIIKASEREKIKEIEGIMKRTLNKTKERIAEVYTTNTTKENWMIERRKRSKRHMIKIERKLKRRNPLLI